MKARDLWIRILTARVETGEPYIIYGDHVNRAIPEHHKLSGLEVKMSNLCSEITLPTGEDHLGKQRTAVCCLSSLNLETYEEWRDVPGFIEDIMTLPDEVHRFVVDELTVRRGVELACYQPKFIVDQVVAACKFDGREAAMDSDTVAQAISNLYVGLDGAQEGAAARQNRAPDGQAKAPADDVWNEARQQLRN